MIVPVPAGTDWAAYRRCRCGAGPGEPCVTVHTHVATGRPEGPPRQMQRPHLFRRLAGRR